MTPEGKLKQDCRRVAKRLGLIFWNIEGKGIGGVPDTLCGKVGGGIVFVEFKRPSKEPTEQQYKRISELLQTGAEAGWTDNYEGWCELIGCD